MVRQHTQIAIRSMSKRRPGITIFLYNQLRNLSGRFKDVWVLCHASSNPVCAHNTQDHGNWQFSSNYSIHRELLLWRVGLGVEKCSLERSNDRSSTRKQFVMVHDNFMVKNQVPHL